MLFPLSYAPLIFASLNYLHVQVLPFILKYLHYIINITYRWDISQCNSLFYMNKKNHNSKNKIKSWKVDYFPISFVSILIHEYSYLFLFRLNVWKWCQMFFFIALPFYRQFQVTEPLYQSLGKFVLPWFLIYSIVCPLQFKKKRKIILSQAVLKFI